MSFDKEKAENNLKSILDKLYTGSADIDLNELREYNKLYKKNISIFKRAWTAAYLFMYYNQRETPDAVKGNSGKRRNTSGNEYIPNSANGNNKNEISSIIELPEEEAKKLFLSIGKNRRLFPRDIISLIMTQANTAREDIGIIKILDNYSFIQVRAEKADDIIAALNGYRFRGRTLAVNYAKPKNPEEDTP